MVRVRARTVRAHAITAEVLRRRFVYSFTLVRDILTAPQTKRGRMKQELAKQLKLLRHRPRVSRVLSVSAGLIAALAATASNAAAPHTVTKARTISVTVVGTKLSKAAAGGRLVSGVLAARSVPVRFSCPAGSTLKRGRVSTLAGTGTWRSPSVGKGGRGKSNVVVFPTVKLADGSALRSMCPENKKGSVFRNVSMQLEADCRTGSQSRITSAQFPQAVRLDCDQIETVTTVKQNQYRHTCPPGYQFKGLRHRTTTLLSKQGYGSPRTCVRSTK